MEMITGMMDLGMMFLNALMILMILNVITTEITNAVELIRESKYDN